MTMSEAAKILFDETGAVVLSEAIDSLDDLPFLPVDQITFPEDMGFLDNIGIMEFSTTEQPTFSTVRIVLLFAIELKLDIPGLEGFSLVAGSIGTEGGTQVALEMDLGDDVFELRIIGNVALRFARNVLKPVQQGPNGWEEILDHFSEIRVDGILRIDGDGDVTIDGFNAFDLVPSMIADSGIIIEVDDLTPILSSKAALPAGHPPEITPGWRGVFIKKAAVHFAGDVDLPIENLAFENCYLGSGGFTGEISTTWTTDPPTGSLFGATISLTKIHLGFRQNALTASEIAGTFMLPFFDEPVDIEIGIDLGGAFSIKLASSNGLYTLTKEDILTLELESLGFAFENGIFKVILSGSIQPLIGGLDWPTFQVKELSIDNKGNVNLPGGWLDLGNQFSLSFYGFQFEITKIGFGKTEDGGNWVGFSGGLKLVDGFSAGASVEGLRVTWYPDGRISLSLNGVGVEFEVPEVLRFKGYVAYRELPGNVHRFDGAIKLELIALNLEINAQLVVGFDNNAGYSFFAIYLGIELPAGIPLWATGLGLFGMAGLFALNMEPDKQPDEAWYGIGPNEGWYKKPPEVGVTNLQKWTNRQGSLAVGAGVTIGTVADNGFTFSGRLMLVIIFPGPIIMLEGRANLLKERSSLSDEPIFRALAVLDGRAGSLLFGLDAQYKFGDSGELIQIAGSAEAFFSFSDPGSWHLYLGMDEPREKRIRATIVSIWEANAYFMLDAKRLAMGAWIGYDVNWKFGPLRVVLEAWLEGKTILNWKPPHFFGSIWLHGKVELSVFGFGLGLSIDARLSVDVFDPFHILGEFSVGINLPWPLPDFDVSIELEWGPELDTPPLPMPLKEIAVEHFKVTTSWPLPRGSLLLPNYDDGDGFLINPLPPALPTNTPPPAANLVPVVPVDARPHITFGRAVNDDGLVGVNPQPPNPEWERIGDPEKNEGPVRVRYSLQEIALDKWEPAGSTWSPVARKAATPNPAGVKTLYGSWAPIPQLPSGNLLPGSDPPVGNVKLWLWSKTPFDYTMHTGRSWDEWFTDNFSDYPCIPTPSDRIGCCDFERFPTDERPRFPIDCTSGRRVIRLIPGNTSTATIEQLDTPIGGKHHALCFDGPSGLSIRVTPPAKSVRAVFAPRELPSERICIDFIGNIPRDTNPLVIQDVSFEVFDFRGNHEQPPLVVQGQLKLGNETVIKLPCPASSVELTLSNFSTPSKFEAYNDNGDLVATGEMQDNVPNPQTVTLTGKEIVVVYVFSSGNEAFLHSICFDCGGGAGSIPVIGAGFDAQGNSFGPFSTDNHTLEVVGKDMVLIQLGGRSRVCLVEVCVNIGPDPSQVDQVEKMAQHLIDQLALWSQEGEVLEPHTTYRLKVTTRVQAQGEGDLSGYSEDLSPVEYSYFRTDGPPGLAALSVPVTYPEPDEFKSGLDDLALYVRQTIPASVPAPGEKPPRPRPVYRAYDVGVEFNEDYVDLMYRLERRDLGLYLYDNNNRPVRDAEGRLIVISNRWGETEDLTLTESEDLWITVVNSSRCVELDPTIIPHDKTLTSLEAGQVLDPDTVYEARLVPLLLHEDFGGFSVGDSANGPSGSLDGWIVQDAGSNEGPSVWRVGEAGTPLSRFIEQTSNIWSGSDDATDPVKPGTMLIRNDNPNLPASHPDQPVNWSDYRLSVYLRSADDDAIGVVFRYQNATTYYRFSMDRERKYRRLTRVAAGSHTILAEDDFIYRQNQDYLITVEAIGGSLRIYQDGELAFDVTDNAITKGRIGLYCWASKGAQFRDVRVDDFRAEAPTVYRFKFTTSDFAHFFHHLHSYQDETWLAALPASALSDNELAGLVAQTALPSDPLTDGEARAYEALANAVLGPAAQQNPPEVQLTRIERDGDTVALLLTSPEPIDWNRTALEVQRADVSSAPEMPGDVKLTDVSFGATAPNEESVTVLLREALDLDGHRIEYRHLPGVLVEPSGDPILFEDDFEGMAGLLFEEKFGPNALNHYTIIDEGTNTAPSNWTVSGGHIVQTSNIWGGSVLAEDADKPGTLAITGLPSWGNVRINTRLHSTDDDAIGLVFRFKDTNNTYRFSMDRERTYRRLIKKVNGTVTVLWEDNTAFNQGQPYQVTIEAYDDRLIGYLDNTFLFCVQDSDLPTGQVGLYCWANVGAHFEALQVEALENQPLLWMPGFENLDDLTIIDEESAVSGPSQWSASGGMLTQSSDINVPMIGILLPGTYALGGNTGWRDVQICVRLRSDDDDALGVMFRYQDNENYYRFSMDRQGSYRRLLKVVGGAVTVLWQDTMPYVQGENYDLTLRMIGSELSAYLNGSLLFTVDDNSLKAGRIGFYCWANTGANFERVIVTDRTRRLGRWTIHDEGTSSRPSVWRLSNGALLQTSSIAGGTTSGADPFKPGTTVVAGQPGWTDYRLVIKLRSDDDDAIGLLFRYVDDDNYYQFALDSERSYRRLIKKENGTITTLWQDANGYLVGEPFTLTVDAIGSRLVGYLGDARLFDVSDSTHRSGRIGLYGWENSGMRFESVQVRQLPLEAHALLRDRFRQNDLTGWSVVDEGTTSSPSNWAISNGVLRQISNIHMLPNDRDTLGKQGTQVIGGDAAWTDIIFTAKLRSDDNDTIGLLFRYQDANNYYRFSMDSERQYRRLVKNVGGTFTLLWEDAAAYEVGRTYTISIVADGHTLRGYIDDVPVFIVEDHDLASGRVGLYCWANEDARFSAVRVYPISRAFSDWQLDDSFEFPVPGRWTFVDNGTQDAPSVWELTGGELVQTSNIWDGSLDGNEPRKRGTYAQAGDPAWTDYRVSVALTSQTDDAIGLMFRYVDDDNYYRFSMDREHLYRRLIKKEAGVVSVLWEDVGEYIEGRQYILTIDCIEQQITCYLDGIELFNLEDDALPEGSIALYCWHNTGAHFGEVRVTEPDWTNYYLFGDEKRMPAGMRIRIFAGNLQNAPPVEAGFQRRFLASLDESGQRRLDQAGAELRLVAPHQSEGHVRRFLSDSAYTPVAAKVLRKADGTGFFVVVPSGVPGGSQLPAGEYRMKFTYHRNNTANDPNSQIFSEAGNTNHETVTLDIPWQTKA